MGRDYCYKSLVKERLVITLPFLGDQPAAEQGGKLHQEGVKPEGQSGIPRDRG